MGRKSPSAMLPDKIYAVLLPKEKLTLDSVDSSSTDRQLWFSKCVEGKNLPNTCNKIYCSLKHFEVFPMVGTLSYLEMVFRWTSLASFDWLSSDSGCGWGRWYKIASYQSFYCNFFQSENLFKKDFHSDISSHWAWPWTTPRRYLVKIF